MLLDASDLEFTYSIFAAFAATCSASVLLTAAMFPDMTKQLFLKMVMYISFCTMVANIFAAVGFPGGNTRMCTTQAIIVNLFFKASWFWTTCLSLEIYSIFLYGKHGLSLVYMHLICWPLALFLTVIPLTTSSFGRSDDMFTEGWCFLRTKTSFQEILWAFVTFYSPLMLCIGLMIYFSVRIHLKYLDFNLQTDNPHIKAVVDSMFLYPVCLIVTWGPILIVSILANFEILDQSSEFASTYNIVTILATQTGAFITLIFFWKSAEARFRWYEWLRRVFGCGCCCCASGCCSCCASHFVKAQDRLTVQTNLESGLNEPLLGPNIDGKDGAEEATGVSNLSKEEIIRNKGNNNNLHFFRSVSFGDRSLNPSESDVFYRSRSGSITYESDSVLHEFMGGFISPPLSLSGQEGEYEEEAAGQFGVVPAHFHPSTASSVSSRVSSHDSFEGRVLSSLQDSPAHG